MKKDKTDKKKQQYQIHHTNYSETQSDTWTNIKNKYSQ